MIEENHHLKKTITILETSDLHGTIFPYRYGDGSFEHIGAGKIATLIKQERQTAKHVLVIDNGDLIQGTPLMYHYVKYSDRPIHPMIYAMNELQIDCAVLGNHEFNYGKEVLTQATRQSHFPWLSSNIVKKQTTTPYFGKPYIVKMMDDIKVAILGATTHFIPNWEEPSHIEAFDFLDAKDTIEKWVAFIRTEEQPDVLVVSYHGGFENDIITLEPEENQTGENQGSEICQTVPGIDVLLTGHQHRKISGHSIHDVTIVQPGARGEALGKVTIELEKQHDKWVIVNKNSSLLYAQDAIADEEILSKLLPYEQDAEIWLDTPIGNVNGDMTIHDAMQARLIEHPFIEFLNRVQMDAAGVDISCTALFDNHAKGFVSQITMRDIVSNYIYPNTLKVLQLSGQDVKDALERSASYFTVIDGEIQVSSAFCYPKPQHYNYDMWEGIDYTIDLSKPIGKRIISLTYKDQPLDLKGTYAVVMNNYRAVGGGHYPMFKQKPVLRDIPIDMTELIANYLERHPIIEATVNHNWRIIK